MENNKIIYSNTESTHFFYSDKDGLCMKNKSGTKVLMEDAYSDFDVCMMEDNIYIICQNMQGDIILLRYGENEWKKYTLLVSKNKQAYDKSFYLLPTGRVVQLFYVIKTADKSLLVHQIIGAGANPDVVASIESGHGRMFFAVSDADYNTYVYFQRHHGGIGYRVYKWSEKSFGSYIPLADGKANSIHVLCDSYGRQHICCGFDEQTAYFCRGLNGEITAKASVACKGEIKRINPYISIDYDKIYIIWESGGSLVYSVSTDDGKSFAFPTKVMSMGDVIVEVIHQKNNIRTLSAGYLRDGEIRIFLPQGSSPGIKRPLTPDSKIRNTNNTDRKIEKESNSEIIVKIDEAKKALREIGNIIDSLRDMIEKRNEFN